MSINIAKAKNVENYKIEDAFKELQGFEHQLKETMETVFSELQKFKGKSKAGGKREPNKAAGTRVRKGLQATIKLCRDIRRFIQDIKNQQDRNRVG